MSGKTVWVVERGSYSDYRVMGVFSTKRNAELFAKVVQQRRYGDSPTVAEWPLNPGLESVRRGYRCFGIIMLRDGTVELCEPNQYADPGEESVSLWERTKAPAYRGNPDVQDALQIDTWARNEKHAIKIANEKRTQMIAANKWPAL